MEIRANYLFVGAFTLLVLLGGVAFTLWIGARGEGVSMADYDIYFTESVRGLSVTNDVLFSGIRVGKVTEIKISRVTPGEVKVRISINADTPVRDDSIARLELRGITGVSVVSISGGTAKSPLKSVPPDEVGEIASETSPLTSAMNQVPDLIASANHMTQQIEKIFSDENAVKIAEMLDSLTTISKTLSDNSEAVSRLIDRSESVARNFDLLVANANEALTTDVKATTGSVSRIARRVDQTLSAMEPSLMQLSRQSLPELRMLMGEMRNLVHVLTRVSQKLESDPRRFLFGDQVKEYQN